MMVRTNFKSSTSFIINDESQLFSLMQTDGEKAYFTGYRNAKMSH